MESSKKQKRSILFFLLVLFIPFLYLFGFPHPIADDLGFAYQAKQVPLLKTLVDSYFYTNGLYTGNIFMYSFPISLNELMYYRTFLFICFLLFVSSAFYFIHTIFYSLKWLDKSIISLCFVLTILGSTTDLAEAFYWQTSVIYYQLGLCFALYYFGFLVKYFQQTYIVNKSVHQAILLLMLILIIGMKESIALIMGLVAVLLFYYSQYKTKNNKVFFTIHLIIAVIFIAILSFSPGNDVRMLTYSNNKNFSYSLLYSGMQMARFSLTWLLAFSGIVMIFIIAEYHQHAIPLLKKLNWKLELAVFFAILFLCIFPTYWTTGILGQHRTLNVASLFFVLFMLGLAINQGKFFTKKLVFSLSKKAFFFVLVFFFVGNGWMVVSDIVTGKVKNYDIQLTERANQISSTHSIAKLPLLKNAPESLFVVDIQKDTAHWINQSYLLGIN